MYSSYNNNELCKKTGAKILLDVNNIYVSSQNNHFSAIDYIENIIPEYVSEIHLAGYVKKMLNDQHSILIDTHNNYVSKEVWELFQIALLKCGQVPTLIEWDSDLPSLDNLLNETKKITKYLNEVNVECLI